MAHKIITTPAANIPKVESAKPKVYVNIEPKAKPISTVEDIDGSTDTGKLLLAAIEIIANRIYDGDHSLAITKVKSKAELMFPTESIK